MSYKVRLEIFEGPLDLLLHLVKKNEVEITDIPISLITEQYLSYLNMIQELELDIAGEYLVMATTLTHVKSKMLLPPDTLDDDEEEQDPRAELVLQLLEYKKFKEAAWLLDQREILLRDVFVREPGGCDHEDAETRSFEPPSLFELLSAFREVLQRHDQKVIHEIQREPISVRDRIQLILERLHGEGSLTFEDLFPPERDRRELIVTFLALLELVRLSMVKVVQQKELGEIVLSLAIASEPAPAFMA